MEHGFVRGAVLPQRVALDITMKNVSADAIESECQHAGLHGIEVVNSLKEQFEALGPVVLFIKQLLATSNLNDPYSGGLGSYALTLMVAFVLQNKAAAGDGTGQCLLAVLEYYMNTFDASNHRIFSELQSKTENVEDCAETLLIVPGKIAQIFFLIAQISFLITQISFFITQISCLITQISCFITQISCFIVQISCLIAQISCFIKALVACNH